MDEISGSHFRDLDWMSYHVDREVATYADQVPEHGQYTEFANSQWVPGRRLKDYLIDNNGSAVAFNIDGRVRFYDQMDLGTMKRKSMGWNTYFNLNSKDAAVIGLNRKQDVDFCCPRVRKTTI